MNPPPFAVDGAYNYAPAEVLTEGKGGGASCLLVLIPMHMSRVSAGILRRWWVSDCVCSGPRRPFAPAAAAAFAVRTRAAVPAPGAAVPTAAIRAAASSLLESERRVMPFSMKAL